MPTHAAPAAPAVLPSTRRAVIGGYTETDRTGVEVWIAGTHGWHRAGETASPHPSWLVDLGGGRLLAVGEGDPSTLSSVRLVGERGLQVDAVLPLSGTAACHAAAAGGFAVVAHYGSGSVSSVRLDDDGHPQEEVDHVTFTGSGPDPERQEAPHAHQVVLDGEEVLVCDLGTDRIHRLRLDPNGRLHAHRDPIELPPGFGPRHLARVGGLVVVAGELSAQLWLARVEGDHVEELDLVTLSEQECYPSALRADGHLVWTGLRGPDTITAHRLADERLELVAQTPTGGRWPRDVVVTDREVWVTNQLSDEVTVLERGAVLAAEPAPIRARLRSSAPTCVVLPRA